MNKNPINAKVFSPKEGETEKRIKIPYTPFSTPLSRSARETELRIRNLFTGPKKRPPVLLMALVLAMCLLCGNLVSCQPGAGETSGKEDGSDALPWEDPSLADDSAREMLFWETAAETLFSRRDDYSEGYGGGEILLSASGEDRNLLLASYAAGGHTGGFRNLLLGTFDGDGQLVDFYALGGDSGLWSSWTEGGVRWLLCANTSTWQGWEQGGAPMCFLFDGRTLEAVDDLSQVTQSLPEEFLAPMSRWDCDNLKFLPRVGALDVYRRTEGWDNLSPADQNVPQWKYADTLYLSETPVDPTPEPVYRAARAYIDAAELEGVPRAGDPILRLEQRAVWDDFSLLSLAPRWRDAAGLVLTAWDLDFGDPGGSGWYTGTHLLFLQNGDELTFVTTFYDHPLGSAPENGLLAGFSPYNWYAVEALAAEGFLTARPRMADIYTKVPAPVQAWSAASALLEREEEQKVWLHREDDYCWVADYDTGLLANRLLAGSLGFTEGSLCIEGLSPRYFCVEEPHWALVYELKLSRFRSGQWEALPGQLAFFSVSSFRNFERCLAIRPVSEVADVDQAARAAIHGLLDYEVALWDRSTPDFPTAYGPGNYDGVFTAQGSEELEDGWREWGDRYEAFYTYGGWNGRFCTSLDTSRRLPTSRGAKAGDSRERVRSLYPELRSETYPGLEGDYLWYCAGQPETHSSLIFVFEGETVSRVVLRGPLGG